MSTRCPYGISGCSVTCCPTAPGICSRHNHHEGTCNGFPRSLDAKNGVYCYTPRDACTLRYCAVLETKEPAWVTALKTQLARVTEERDQAREAAEDCRNSVERLAVELRAERAAHHD